MYIGIICEFDPLHSGHARLLSHARAMGADAVICAMSGNFTQRGRFAALDKRARAEMAVAAPIWWWSCPRSGPCPRRRHSRGAACSCWR